MAQVEQYKRKFKYEDIELEDPNPEWNTKRVIDFYSAQYPEMVNCHLEGPEVNGTEMVYSITTKTGTKG